MNDMEINQQIKQMQQFIHQEAAEKASEIKLKAGEELRTKKAERPLNLLGTLPLRLTRSSTSRSCGWSRCADASELHLPRARRGPNRSLHTAQSR